jgi:hypothetical protein
MSLGDTLPIVSPGARRAPGRAQPTAEAGVSGSRDGGAEAQRVAETPDAAERRPQHLGESADGPANARHQAAEAAPGAPRMGAHAAPYMDARGVLHNLKPIGRLVVTGPDTEPRRGDTEFGSLWFEATEETAEGLPTRQRVRPDGDDSVVIDLDVTGLVGGAAQNGPSGDERTGNAPEPALPLIPGPEPVLAEAEEAPKAARREKELTAADLEAIRWRLDGGTLREVVDDKDALRDLGEKLDEPLADDAGNVAKAGLLSVRAEVYRLLGELGMAAAASRLALAHAESARDTQSMVIAQAELAHVLRLRGDFGEADRLFAKAASARVPAPLRSVVHENAGRCCFDQGRYMEALDHFARAVRLGRTDDTELAERIGVCLEAVYIHVLRDGWGPYPRLTEQPTP